MTATVPRIELAPGYSIARILNGGWQLSRGHGAEVDPRNAVNAMVRLADAGFTTFDCADIYTGVEELLGRFLVAWNGRSEIQIHTKYVPDKSALASLTRRDVEATVDRSLARLGVERLDLVQYYWWDDDVPGRVEAALWLDELRRKGKIRHLGATNFNVRQLAEIVDAGVPLIANQVQVSLLDRRTEHGMVRYCAEHGIHLLAYGSLAGGFLSERYLGRACPDPLPNRSLVKYRLIIEEFGGWELFQELLGVLESVADRHGVSVANVAARWVLDREAVAGAIIGARSAAHLESNRRIFDVALDAEDHRRLDAVLERSPGPAGDCFDLERVPGGRHAVIMKTNLGRAGGGALADRSPS